jgi:hypothetical protein
VGKYDNREIISSVRRVASNWQVIGKLEKSLRIRREEFAGMAIVSQPLISMHESPYSIKGASGQKSLSGEIRRVVIANVRSARALVVCRIK